MTKPILITSCYVAGIPHRNPDLTNVTVGSEVSLIPDPQNQFDPNAIQVHSGSQFLGFIPREATPPIHSALRDGAKISARVTERSNTKWKEAVIQVAAIFPS